MPISNQAILSPIDAFQTVRCMTGLKPVRSHHTDADELGKPVVHIMTGTRYQEPYQKGGFADGRASQAAADHSDQQVLAGFYSGVNEVLLRGMRPGRSMQGMLMRLVMSRMPSMFSLLFSHIHILKVK